MPKHMFGEVTDPSIKVGSGKWYTVPLSLLTHTVAISAIIIVPILATATLPTPEQQMMAYNMTVIKVPAPPPPAPRRDIPRTEPTDPRIPFTEAPTGFKPEPEYTPPSDPTGPEDRGTVVGEPKIEVEPPPPPPPPVKDEPLPVGGNIKAPAKVRHVSPAYPAIAQAARISGIVIIQATIDESGRVTDTRLLRSIPLLDQAALEAVRQWQFTPTLLNGKPISIIMTVTVNFSLQ